MSTAPAGPVIPESAGLPHGRSNDHEDERPRTSDELIARTAEGEAIDALAEQDLLRYFLNNGELPDDSKPIPLEFEVGNAPKRVKNVWQIRRLKWEEWFDATEQCRDKATGELDGYVAASFVVARALVKPKLGPAVKAQRDEAAASDDHKIAGPDGERTDPPKDSAELLRRMFSKQSGVLLDMSGEVRRVSKIGVGDQSARTLDQEVEAAKG